MADPVLQQLLRDALAHHQRGDLARAEALYRQVLARDASHADALHLLGVVAHQSGRSDLATALIQRAIVLNPSAAIYHNNLGEAWRVLGQKDRARACYERALSLNANAADAHLNLGTLLQERGLEQEAAEHYRQSMRLAPRDANAYLNMGNLLHGQGRIDEAEGMLRRAIELGPRSAKAHSNLGVVLQEQGRPEDARACFRRAIEVEPAYAPAHSNLLLCLHYDRGDQAEELFEEHRRWARKFAEPIEEGSGWRTVDASLKDPHPGPLPGGEGEESRWGEGDPRLRVGYVSADFCAHPVGMFLQPLLAGHDRKQFEIFGYSDVTRADAMTQQLAGLCEHWRDTSAMSDEQLAANVREDRIDILVDLAGHTAHNRLLAFARHPAPVQISYLGYPNTTGLSAMDYRLTDARCDPPGLTERFHTETLLRIEPSFLCYRPPSDAGAVAALPARTTGCITFGSFNNFAKVTPAMLRTWAAILRQVSGSRLILKAKGLSSPAARQRVLGMFAAEQIDAQRIELLGQQPSYARHLEAYARIDIALDTFPYCGTTTTCEALWMGVPVISRAGPTHVSRVGCSILSSAGLPQFVAETEAQYIAISARLAEDSKALSEMRLGMRQRLAQSQLCDEQAFVRGVEAAYIRASQRSALTTDPAAGSTPPQTAASSDCNRTTEPKDR